MSRTLASWLVKACWAAAATGRSVNSSEAVLVRMSVCEGVPGVSEKRRGSCVEETSRVDHPRPGV